MQCKVAIVINDEGVEALAKGEQPSCWTYSVIALKEDGTPISGYEEKYVLSKCKPIGEGIVTFPTREEIAPAAVEMLKQQLQEKQAEAFKECQSIQQRIDDILLLGSSPTVVKIAPIDGSEWDKDIPF